MTHRSPDRRRIRSHPRVRLKLVAGGAVLAALVGISLVLPALREAVPMLAPIWSEFELVCRLMYFVDYDSPDTGMQWWFSRFACLLIAGLLVHNGLKEMAERPSRRVRSSRGDRKPGS